MYQFVFCTEFIWRLQEGNDKASCFQCLSLRANYSYFHLVFLSVRTCEVFLCFVDIVRVRVYYFDCFISLSYITGEWYRFSHRGWAQLCHIKASVMRQDQNIVWVEINIWCRAATNETLQLYGVMLHLFFSLRHMETMKVL